MVPGGFWIDSREASFLCTSYYQGCRSYLHFLRRVYGHTREEAAKEQLKFPCHLLLKMGRFNSIFSRSSEKGSNASSDIGRSWTLVSRPQSITTQSPQQRADLSKEILPSELGASKADCISSCEYATNRESPKERPQISRDKLPIDPSALSCDDMVSLALPPAAESSRASRRLAGFKTVFRSRKLQRQRLGFDLLKDKDSKENACDIKEGDDLAREGTVDDVTEANEATAVLDPSSRRAHLSNDIEIRKVSDTTEKSVNSNTTSVTVCRHPSKRMSMPITIVDRDIAHQNPFDDVWEASRSETIISNPFSEQSKTTTESTGQSSSTYSGPESASSSYPGHIVELSGSSQTSWYSPALSGFNGWPTPADRRLAADSFNELANELYLDPLTINFDDTGQDQSAEGGYLRYQVSSFSARTSAGTTKAETSVVARDKLERRRDRLRCRIRMMRSTIHIKAEPALPRARALRRMKTFNGLAFPPCLMTSLRGKDPETLARLGGYSFLSFPGDFAPTTLRLPVCFVATISYLRCFAPSVQGLFVDYGDIETATQTYDYFASQVLSAEKEKNKIHMTMRSSRMPSFLDKDFSPGTQTRRSAQVLSVAFAFKALLAGLPGGILGSMQLYRILVNICHGRVSQGPAQRTGSCLTGLSPEDYAKVRSMSLAILAFTSAIQLNLICGVFGLCALLLHESGRISELERRTHRQSGRRSSTSTADKLSVDRLAQALGPLLTEGGGDEGPDTFHAIQQEIESQRVVSLLIANWRSVSRQLRVWERRGLEARV